MQTLCWKIFAHTFWNWADSRRRPSYTLLMILIKPIERIYERTNTSFICLIRSARHFFLFAERKSSILNFITLLNESEKLQSQACKRRVVSLKWTQARISSAELPKTGNKCNWQCEEPFEYSFLFAPHSVIAFQKLFNSCINSRMIAFISRESFDKVQSQSVFRFLRNFFFFWFTGFFTALITHTMIF